MWYNFKAIQKFVRHGSYNKANIRQDALLFVRILLPDRTLWFWSCTQAFQQCQWTGLWEFWAWSPSHPHLDSERPHSCLPSKMSCHCPSVHRQVLSHCTLKNTHKSNNQVTSFFIFFKTKMSCCFEMCNNMVQIGLYVSHQREDWRLPAHQRFYPLPQPCGAASHLSPVNRTLWSVVWRHTWKG